MEQVDIFGSDELPIGDKTRAHREHEAAEDRLQLTIEVVVVLLGERCNGSRECEDLLEPREVGRAVAQYGPCACLDCVALIQ